MKILLGYVARLFAYLVFISPRFVRKLMGAMIAFLWWDLLRIRRDVVLSNLDIAFPEMEQSNKNKIARKAIYHMGVSLSEYCVFPFLNKKNISNYIVIEGTEYLEQALREKKGVCLLTLHLSNCDFGIAALSLNNYETHVISKLITNEWLNDLWFSLRKNWGAYFIAPRKSAYDIFKALKKNFIVVFAHDQYMAPPLGVETSFFGKMTGTAMGLAVIALRTEAPVVPCYVYRKASGHLVLRCDPAIPLEKRENKEKTIQHMTQMYNNHLQKVVEEFPEQWLWVHRRWKKFTAHKSI